MNTLVRLWDETEHNHSTKTALIFAGQTLTYKELGERIRRFSAAISHNWNPALGDVIALFAPNCPEFVISYFALVRLGLIVQPIDERLTPEEIVGLLDDSGSRHLIVSNSAWPRIEGIVDQLSKLEHVLGIGMDAKDGRLENWINAAPDQKSLPSVDDADVAELMYTSGTTGEPKGVMRSHTNVCAAVRNSIRGFGYRTSDTIVIVMPMSHSSALNSQMIPMIKLGGTIVLLAGIDMRNLIDAIKTYHGTCIRAVPTMLRMLLTRREFCAATLPSLRMIINSSAPIDPQIYAEIKERFDGIEVANSYGLTEASTSTILTDAAACTRPDSIGVPIEGVEMCLIDEDNEIVDDDREGEICICGEHVFAGYYNRPDATKAVLKDGLLRTGDLGYQDKDGFYYLRGRKTDVINCAGRKVIPFEVESCIRTMPQVDDVAVVPAPHRIAGQVAKAFVVPKAGVELKAKQVTQYCGRKLASHKIPFFIEFVPKLPRNSLGKVLRRELEG